MTTSIAWELAYTRYLEHSGFLVDKEIKEAIESARCVISNIPEPYREKLLEYINTFSRDDCVCLCCTIDALDYIFGIETVENGEDAKGSQEEED